VKACLLLYSIFTAVCMNHWCASCSPPRPAAGRGGPARPGGARGSEPRLPRACRTLPPQLRCSARGSVPDAHVSAFVKRNRSPTSFALRHSVVTGLHSAYSVQARAALCSPSGTSACRAALKASVQQAVQGGADKTILDRNTRGPRYQYVAGAGAARYSPFLADSSVVSLGARTLLAQVHCLYSLAGAGTPEEASAWRWLRVHGAAVRSLYGLTMVDKDVERLSILQLTLPALEKVRGLELQARPGAAPAATRAFLVGAARAVARCPCLRTLQLLIELVPNLGEQIPDTLGQELAEGCTLTGVSLRITSRAGEARDWPTAGSVLLLVTGLAGLSRLRSLSLTAENAYMDGALPACVSCLTQLTILSLSGFTGLRCAPGWARLPALVDLEFKACVFAFDGEAALPGMDMLVSLRSLIVDRCPSLHTWPTSLWRLEQLKSLRHGSEDLGACELARLPRSALPVAGLPASALCFPFMTCLTLVGHNLSVFPPGVLAMTRLQHLDLARAHAEGNVHAHRP
jgi:hypothetical protein